MAKREQVLIIEPPNELRFRGPFTRTSITSYIKLTNPSNHKVYFKIKTTAPKRYCVRPNSGSLKPKEVTQIAVTLQPFDIDLVDKNKHKFMVQTVIAPDNDDDSNFDVWSYSHPDELMDSKLKCIFENPITNTTVTKSTTATVTTKTDVNTNDGKNKGVGDAVKSSPKILGEAEEKLMEAAQEVNQLRVEESSLRLENLQLKEDLLKLRNAALGNDANLAAKGITSQSSNQLYLTSTSVIIAVLMVIVGYVLGKLI